MSSSPDDTGQYDMITYAHAFERMRDLRLPVWWKLNVLKKGVMLFMEKNGENERIFIESPKALDNWEQVIIDWAHGKGFGLS